MNKLPALVGILNVTPDSFSDGGKYTQTDAVLAHAVQLAADGASIIDVGGESTRPNATPLTADEEWARLKDLLPELVTQCATSNVAISVDSYHPKNAARALEAGALWVNDVSAARNDDMLRIVADANCPYVLMHSLSIPADSTECLADDEDMLLAMRNFREQQMERLASFGVNANKVIFDPGIGFGKTMEQSWNLLRRAEELKSEISLPLYIGHSRKSFLKRLQPNVDLPLTFDERDRLTVACSLFLAKAGVDYLRVHNVSAHSAALKSL